VNRQAILIYRGVLVSFGYSFSITIHKFLAPTDINQIMQYGETAGFTHSMQVRSLHITTHRSAYGIEQIHQAYGLGRHFG
jgi:hypothetical protein